MNDKKVCIPYQIHELASKLLEVLKQKVFSLLKTISKQRMSEEDKMIIDELKQQVAETNAVAQHEIAHLNKTIAQLKEENESLRTRGVDCDYPPQDRVVETLKQNIAQLERTCAALQAEENDELKKKINLKGFGFIKQ